MNRNTPPFIRVDGVDVPSMDWVFDQQMAQGRRIDRARRLSWLSIAVALGSCLIQILLRLC